MKGLAVAALLALPALASAQPIAVTVIDAAGDRVYVTPGEEAGLRVGTRVAFGPRTLVVVELTAKTAVVRLDDGGPLAIGATGSATPVAPRAPRDPGAFHEQWPTAVPPARVARVPRTVPLDARDATLTVLGSAFAVAGHGETTMAAEARVVATFEQLADVGGRAIGAELDVAARGYTRGWNDVERVPIVVRAAQLTWGRDVALGRIRHAAAGVGIVDGARVGGRVGRVEVAAFGGLAPEPLGAIPSADASRFGAELAYDAPDHAWQPRLAVTALGSTWLGALDERRVIASAAVAHRGTALDGFVEAQSFASDNPFGASAVELVGAGANLRWRDDRRRASLGVAYLRTERTLRLLAALPAEWLADAPWVTASAGAGIDGTSWAIDAVITVGRTTLDERAASDASGYVRGELHRGAWVAFFAPSVARTDFADWAAVEVGGGRRHGAWTVTASYRPERLVERGDLAGPALLHGGLAELRWAASPRIDVALHAITSLGADRDHVAALTTFSWRVR